MTNSLDFDRRIDMMAVMRYPHISKLDLDLLIHLAVLLEERHVTRAANRCFLSQSAMSRQLDRLREALGMSCFCETAGRTKEPPGGNAFYENWNRCCHASRESSRDARSVRRKVRTSFK